jgi:hypothetical protein
MKTINIFLLIILILSTTSCRKHPPKTYTIKGKLLKDCGGEVMANTDMSVTTRQSLPMKQNLLYMKFTSDNDGNFSVSYQQAAGEKIGLWVNGNKILTEIPKFEDIDLGVVYYHPTCNFVFKLVVDSAYTATDTLLITDYNFTIPSNYGMMVIPGPFKDTILSPVYNFSPLETRYYDTDSMNYLKVKVMYSVWNGPRNTADNRVILEQFEARLLQCNHGMDTIIVRVRKP